MSASHESVTFDPAFATSFFNGGRFSASTGVREIDWIKNYIATHLIIIVVGHLACK
jgi:hypothetical protein